jgi:hypothetical protein
VRGSPWVVALAVAGVPLCQHEIDRRMGRFRAQEEILYVWSGEHLRRMAPGFESLLGDVYWLRTVQYYGGQRAFSGEKRYDLLEPLVDITTTLDPQFDIAYRYGAVFLSEPYPAGAGNPQAGVALLRKGVERNPDAWLLWQHLGFFQVLYAHDARGAAASLLEGADRPGAPTWLRTLAAAVLSQHGERDGARSIWRSLYELSAEEPLREIALVNIRRLDALDRVDELTSAAAAFRKRFGRNPGTWEELQATGLATLPAVDPAGHTLDYDSASGLFSVSRGSPLWATSLRAAPPSADGARQPAPDAATQASEQSVTRETARPQKTGAGR